MRGLPGSGSALPPPVQAHPEDEIEDEEQVFDALGAALYPHGGAGGGRPAGRVPVLGGERGAWGPGERLGAWREAEVRRRGARGARGRGTRRDADEASRRPGRDAPESSQSLRAHSEAGRAPRSGIYGAPRPRPQAPPRGPAPGPAAGAQRGGSRSPQRGPGRAHDPPAVAHTLRVSDCAVRTQGPGRAVPGAARISGLRARSSPRGAALEDWPAAREDSLPPSPRLLGAILGGATEEVMRRSTAKRGQQRALFRTLSGTESRVRSGVRRPWRRPWREDPRSWSRPLSPCPMETGSP